MAGGKSESLLFLHKGASEMRVNPLREHESVTLAAPVEVLNIFTLEKIIMEKGETGTVVLVHGDPESPLAYEIEFYDPDRNIGAVATVKPADIL
jgi:hypothetical protein